MLPLGACRSSAIVTPLTDRLVFSSSTARNPNCPSPSSWPERPASCRTKAPGSSAVGADVEPVRRVEAEGELERRALTLTLTEALQSDVAAELVERDVEIGPGPRASSSKGTTMLGSVAVPVFWTFASPASRLSALMNSVERRDLAARRQLSRRSYRLRTGTAGRSPLRCSRTLMTSAATLRRFEDLRVRDRDPSPRSLDSPPPPIARGSVLPITARLTRAPAAGLGREVLADERQRGEQTLQPVDEPLAETPGVVNPASVNESLGRRSKSVNFTTCGVAPRCV